MPLLTVENPENENAYLWAADIQRAMWEGFWTSRKFTFESDIFQFNRMSPEMRQVVIRTIAAIAQVENKVKKYWAYFGMHVADSTIVGAAITMAGVEEIHHDAYRRLLRLLGIEDEIQKALEAAPLANRVAYLNKHTLPYSEEKTRQTLYSLILFTGFVEHVSLFGPFSNILAINRLAGENRPDEEKLLKDTSQQVKYTRNEESLHSLFGIGVINEMRKEYSELFDDRLRDRIYEEVQVAYKAEAALTDWILEGYDNPDHNAEIVKNYIRERFNEYLTMIGYEPQFDVDPELSKKTLWMKVGVYAPPKVDFFNSDPTSYARGDASDDDDF